MLAPPSVNQPESMESTSVAFPPVCLRKTKDKPNVELDEPSAVYVNRIEHLAHASFSSTAVLQVLVEGGAENLL